MNNNLPKSEYDLIELSRTDPNRLEQYIQNEEFELPLLTFAAEILGETENPKFIPTLLGLLDHKSPLAREGAILGLEYYLQENSNETIIKKLEEISTSDPSPGIRNVAEDVLFYVRLELSTP
jgi:HEAT repeat protein